MGENEAEERQEEERKGGAGGAREMNEGDVERKVLPRRLLFQLLYLILFPHWIIGSRGSGLAVRKAMTASRTFAATERRDSVRVRPCCTSRILSRNCSDKTEL